MSEDVLKFRQKELQFIVHSFLACLHAYYFFISSLFARFSQEKHLALKMLLNL